MLGAKRQRIQTSSWLRQDIYVDNQTIRVVYYIKAGEKEDEYGIQIEVYEPEGNSRLARDRVSWNSVIGLSEGEWNDTTWERPAIQEYNAVALANVIKRTADIY